MGYIEREAVMQKFADLVERSNNSDFAEVPTWNQAVQIVEDFPAADVRPVVRGTWITRPYMMGNTQYCSLCGENYGVKYNFCPNCGTDMRAQ